MALEVGLAFVAACVLLALTPGPAMSLIIANATTAGTRAGLVTVAGNTLGFCILLLSISLGMSSLMVFMAEWFDVLRWVGALYLFWLGGRQLVAVWRNRAADPGQAPQRRGNHFAQGLFVALSNPKVLLFLGAFLPQFVDPERPALPQLLTLSVLFALTLTPIDALFALAAGHARGWITPKSRRAMEGVTAGMLLLGGLVLATARRPV